VNNVEQLCVQVANLSTVPSVLAVAQDASSAAPPETGFAERVQGIESEWQTITVDDSRLLRGILENEASVFLRLYNSVVAAFREILITDSYGRLVAASNKASDYFQADEQWWRIAYLEGDGQRYVSDIHFDESAQVDCIEIAEPIRSRETGEVIGIIKAIVDSDAVFALLETIQLGPGVEGVLIRPDGSYVSSPDSDERYPYLEDFRSAMNLNRHSTTAGTGDSRIFLGLPEFGVQERLPELNWYLLIQAPYSEVFAPFRNLRAWFMYIVAFSVGLIICLSLLFTWILSRPIIETDPHLKEA
jgi:hypothetical protein